MATNKRKDSAALFELIDKSTLKVPKHASGALKIPTWWSSKTNAPVKGAAAAAAPVAEKATATVNASSSSVVASGPAPSIRPPTAPPAPASTADAGVRRPAALPPKPQVYVPNTMDRSGLSRAPLAGNIPGTRIPIWAAAVGGLVAVVIIVAVIAMAMRQHTVVAPSGDGTGMLVTPGVRTTGLTPYDPAKDGSSISNAMAGQLLRSPWPRDPNLYYLIITNYPRQDMADKAANFLADHGVDLSIEISVDAKGKHYWLISGKGFTAIKDPDAQEFQRKVIQIGHEPFEGRKRSQGIFPDARFAHITRG